MGLNQLLPLQTQKLQSGESQIYPKKRPLGLGMSYKVKVSKNKTSIPADKRI